MEKQKNVKSIIEKCKLENEKWKLENEEQKIENLNYGKIEKWVIEKLK